MPRRPSSWGTPCRPSRCWLRRPGVYLAVPVAARIHEGLVWSNRDRRTLLDKLGALLLGLPWDRALTVVADAYYAAAKFARAFSSQGHHLVTRVRCNAVAYFPPSPPKGKRRWTARSLRAQNQTARLVPLPGNSSSKRPARSMASPGVRLRYYAFDLIWRPLGRLVRFVWVIHPTARTAGVALAPI